MGSPEKLLLWPTAAFILGTASLVLARLLNGQIRTRGLLRDPRTGRTSALAVQKLITTLAFASTYAASIRSSHSASLPPVTPEILALVGGSNALLVINRGFHQILAAVRDAVRSR
jgi:hypothetical protein